jgi:uncharacterized protein
MQELITRFIKKILSLSNRYTYNMNKRDLVLASLLAAGTSSYEPVQIQKTLFLFQKRGLNEDVFNFTPYAYGPFDSSVYSVLEELEQEGIVEIIVGNSKYRKYRLNDCNSDTARQSFEKLNSSNKEYLKELSSWVRSLSFSQLVSAIYKEYPDMKVNSVFKGE